MAKPKKNLPPTQELLPAATPPPPAPPTLAVVTQTPPAALDFKWDRPWRIENFEALAAEFHLQPDLSAGEPTWSGAGLIFCRFAQPHTRQWLVVRRLFGVAPVVPPEGTHPDDLRCWTRAELAAEGFEVQAELDALRAMWMTACRPQPAGVEAAPTAKVELALDDTVLSRFQFNERIFRINVWDPVTKLDMARPEPENRAERDWFVRRVQAWSKMLVDDIAGPIARDALMNDLYLRRLESDIATASTKDHDKLYERKERLAEAYQEKIEKLQGMFPEMAVAGKVSFRGTLGDLTAGWRDYYGNGDQRLLDKVFTALELEFATRSSLQVPARHRFSLSLAIIECSHNLYNADFRSQLKPTVLKKLDAAYHAAVEAAREAGREPVVDLERGVTPDEGDQFEEYEDALCPDCNGRISSSARKCRHCAAANPNDRLEHENYQPQ